jgi:hypothetical protein
MSDARPRYIPSDMPPTGHQVSDERLEEFRRIYKMTFGEEITTAEAVAMTHRLIALYKLVMRPLPDETSTSAPAQQPPAQNAPEEPLILWSMRRPSSSLSMGEVSLMN